MATPKRDLLSSALYEWWSAAWRTTPLTQSRIMLLQHVMNTTPRAGVNAGETIGYGFMHSRKGFYDGETVEIRERIDEIDPLFFDEYPGGVDLGEVARAFYRQGFRGHTKPNLGPRSTPDLMGAI